MPTTELLTLAKELIDGGDYTKVREDYNKKKLGSVYRIGAHEHKILVGNATKLAKLTITNGGTKSEIYWCVLWLYICMDALKYDLDCNKFWNDHEDVYSGIIKKYATKES